MDLVRNILFFSQALRKRKVGVTVNNVMDALRGSSFIDIQKKEDFYNLLRSNFVSHQDEGKVFNELFEQFWSGNHTTPDHKRNGEGPDSEEEELPSPGHSERGQLLSEARNDQEGDERPKEEEKIPQYSPEEVLGRKDFCLLDPAELEKVKEFVTFLSRRIALRLSRRWKSQKRGERIDFRRSLRQSMKYGGEMVELRMRRRKRKPLRLILVCDVSGSMDIHSQFFLLFMFGLQNYYPHCETFAFSTRLNHVTPFLRRRTFEETLRLLSENVLDWSGGTNIGGALHHLHQCYSDFLSPNRTLFFIFSDGWDRGDAALLDFEMGNLKRQVKKLIWLNPLLGSRDYQPLCEGMATALPYLDHFLPCHNFLSLKNLKNHILGI
ncbi:MAG: VWA domain-containing protein [Thermodesulfobacteriota bacterium]